MSHVNINDLDLSKIALAKMGRNVVLVYPNENSGKREPLQLVTGKMYIPFGVKKVETNYSQWFNCHIDCSLNQSKSEESVKYQEAIDRLDARIKELVETSELFDISESSLYFPILKENRDYPKLIKISLPRDSQGNFKPFIFDENKEQIVLTDSNVDEILSKGTVFASIIECARMWQYNGKIGSTWNLVQLKLMPRSIQQEQKSTSSYKELMIED